ncbi:MAG: DUF4124 domain-containing protein [Nitrospirota bacterium]
MILRDRRDHCLVDGGTVTIFFATLLLLISCLLLSGTAFATTIYSYVDERGTPVLTDNFESIPERYRAKVQVTEQAPKSATDHSAAVRLQQNIADWARSQDGMLGIFTQSISGLTPYQSKVFTFGGIAAVICLLARIFGRNQVIRFLSLWCLIMVGLIAPALFFTSRDAPLDRLTGQAEKIQDKQQEHLQRAL